MENSRIVLVEDNDELRATIANYVLRPAGYTVIEASDGITGLAIITAHNPSLAIVDMQMPGMDGLTLVETLREQQKETPVILITAEGSEKLASRAIQAGVVGYIPKPFEPEELLITISNVLEQRSLTAAFVDELKRTNVRLERRVQQLETLQAVSRAVTSSLDLEDVLSKVVAAAVKVTDAEEGSLLLLEDLTGELTMVAAKNFDDEFVRTFRIKSDDSLAGEVLHSGEPYLMDAEAPTKIKTAYLVRSLLYVPLKIQDKTIGVLGVDNRHADAVFTEDDIVPLSALANYAASAIENARLYAHTEAERSQLEAVLEQTEDVVIVMDNEFHIILMNPTARAAFDVQTDDVVGKPLLQIVPNADVQALFKDLDLSKKRARHAEIALDDKNVLNAHLTPIEGVGWVMVMQDISHLKQLDRIKSEFVSTVSHDLRSPLTAVLGYTELLPRAGPINPQQLELIRRVRFSVNSITALISDLLDLGRIEAGFDTRKEEVSLSQMIYYATEGLVAKAKDKQIKLITKLPDDIETLYGNPVRLRQMVANLIENAIKYTPKNGEVTITLEQTGDSLLFTIKDTGIGVPPGEQQKIFDKFYRSDDVPLDVAGTGLGLSIVKSIVENHAGRIWVDSKLGEGSMFTVLLPLIHTQA